MYGRGVSCTLSPRIPMTLETISTSSRIVTSSPAPTLARLVLRAEDVEDSPRRIVDVKELPARRSAAPPYHRVEPLPTAS